MKKESKTLIKKYYNEVKNSIPVSFPNKKNVLKEIEYSLSAYASEHDNFSYDNLIDNFGEPIDYANSLLENTSIDGIRKQLYNSKKITLAIIGIVVLLILSCIFLAWFSSERATQGFETIEEENIVISE